MPKPDISSKPSHNGVLLLSPVCGERGVVTGGLLSLTMLSGVVVRFITKLVVGVAYGSAATPSWKATTRVWVPFGKKARKSL
jgi:hypothetical protein